MSGKQGKFSMLGKNGSAKGGAGYSSSPSPKKVSSKVANSSAASSAKEEGVAKIGCHAGNVYEDSYTVARRYPGSVTFTMSEAQAGMCNSGAVPCWVLRNLDAIRYRAGNAKRGSERFGDGRGLIKSAAFIYVNNGTPVQILFTSQEMSGRVYTNDGKRGLLSFPSGTSHVYHKPQKVYFSGEISNAFLRYADVDLQKLMGDAFRETTAGADGGEVVHYAVPMDNEIGKGITDNLKNNKDLTAGIGDKFAIQYHPVRKGHYRLTEEQYAQMLALITDAGNSGRPICMNELDISVHPVQGTWKDLACVPFSKGTKMYDAYANSPCTVEFEIELVYRQLSHPDMKIQQR